MRLACALALWCVGCGGDEPMPLGSLDFAGADGFVSAFDLAPTDLPRIVTDLPMDPKGPMITIVTPKPDEIVAGPTLTVTATVVPQAGQKDVKSVIAYGPPLANGKMPAVELSLTKMPDTYVGSLDVTPFISGPLDVAVVATDLDGHSSSAKVTCRRDAGPVITVYQPSAKTYKGSAPVLFKVDDSFGVNANDPNAVAASVQTVPIALSVVQGQGAPVYSGTVDFQDKQFKAFLTGLQALHLRATNVNGTTTELDVAFTVDSDGPKITILQPEASAFVGGFITIEAEVTDISGVAEVVAQIPDVDKNDQMIVHAVKLAPEGNQQMASDKFAGSFDTRQLNPNFVYSAFLVTARDNLGNYDEAAEEVIVDNSQPAIALDPPKTRVRKRQLGMPYECSQLFDPVGGESANDGDMVPQVVWLKARAEDRGNQALGLAVEHPSLLKHDQVELWAVNAANGPLVVDTDGDGNCDDVNPDLVPSTNALMPKTALVVSLVQIPITGVPDFTPDGLAVPPLCDFNGDGMALSPKPLCNATTMTLVLGYTDGLLESSIWTIPKVVQGGADCVGFQLDTLNKLADGEVCATVRARDNAGNHNVAPPLRLCLAKNGDFQKCDPQLYQPHGQPDAQGHANLPKCTGTVDQQGKVTNTPCNPGVLLNNGKFGPPFPIASEPYIYGGG